MWSTRDLSHSGAHNFVRRAVYTKAVNHQSTSDYPRPPEETGKPPAGGYPDTNPQPRSASIFE
jgi:hypothetical protein